MKAKQVLTIVLLMFVAASFVVLVVKSLRQPPQAQQAAAGMNPVSTETGEQPPADAVTDGVVAYYFHGNTRCPTCRAIEAYAHEAVQGAFPAELQSGRLAWRVVNYESPGNEHFATDYEVIAPTVVLVRKSGGAATQWKNLDRVWELVGDKEGFCEYVEIETRALLEGSTG